MTAPAASAAARAGAHARGAPKRIARRYSGPAGGAIAVPRPRVAEPRRRARAGAAPLPARALHVLARVPDHSLLDRLIRGRFWIVLIAFALIGIVAMQVSLLKLNAGIGRALAHSSLLQRQNAELRAQISRLTAGDRVQAEAARLGMVTAPAGSIRFLTARPGADARQALAALSTGSAGGSASAGTAGGLASAGTAGGLASAGTATGAARG